MRVPISVVDSVVICFGYMCLPLSSPLSNITSFFSWILSRLLGLLVERGCGPSLECKHGYFCELLLFLTQVKKDDLAMVL